MFTRQENNKILETIDRMLAESGSLHNRICTGEFTTKQILQRAEIPNTERNWSFIIRIVKAHYPSSKWERGSQDNGFNLKIKTRVK